VGPIACLDDVENILVLPGLELRSLGRPTRSHSPYRLRYPGSCYTEMALKIKVVCFSEIYILAHVMRQSYVCREKIDTLKPTFTA
jgi:hypothetical protein